MTFIAIEGIDGVGKATQTKLLVQALEARGHTCFQTEFPQYKRNKFGQHIARWLAGEYGNFIALPARDASILYANDRFESQEEIKTALADHKIVVSDRYTASNMIHQGGKNRSPIKREKFLSWLDLFEHHILKNARPDVIIYLDAPVSLSLQLLANKRASKGLILADGMTDQAEEDVKHLTQSHEMAQWLANRNSDWRWIDCSDNELRMKSREEIHTDVMAAVKPFL